MRRREGQGGATHKKIGPSDGGRLLYRLYFNADRTCNTKEKKKLNRNKDKQSTTEAFHGRRKLSLFLFLWQWHRLSLVSKKTGPFRFDMKFMQNGPNTFFGIWHITRRWHLAKIWTCTRRNWGYPRGSYISSPSLISRRLIFRTCTAPLHCENLLLAKGKWEILFTSQSLSVWIFFSFFFSFLLAESLTSLWNVNASLTRPFPTQTLFDFWHSTCHENGTSIQSFDYIEVHALNFHPFQIFCWF